MILTRLRSNAPKTLSKKELSHTATDQTHSRGEELRKVFWDTYRKLSGSRELRTGLGGTDVTNIVLPYIPIGTQFEEAEAILRAAGFVVGPRPNHTRATDPNRTKNWFCVVARISPFHKKLFYKASLYVSIMPRSPGDYTDVVGLKATFFVSMP
jgi:hypothetical protein